MGIEDYLNISTEGLSEPEVDTVNYLKFTMAGNDEKALLARVLYNSVALGKLKITSVAEEIGSFDPEGIVFDEPSGDIAGMDQLNSGDNPEVG